MGFQALLALVYSISPISHIPFLSFDAMIILYLYWVMHDQETVWLGSAWGVGMLKDVLVGSLLGEHALALTLVVYLMLKLVKRMQFFSFWQQALGVGALVLVNQLMIALIEGLQGHFAPMTLLIYPPLFSAVCWLIGLYLFSKDDTLYSSTSISSKTFIRFDN